MEIVEKNPFENLDEYELRHFVEHLKDANRFEDAHRVLLQENILTVERHSPKTKIGKWLGGVLKSQSEQQKFYRNAWYAAQQRIGEIRNFIKDVQLCWRLAEIESRELVNKAQMAPSVVLELRYALISTSLNNLAANIPTALLLRLLQTNFLTIEQALTYAEQIPDLSQKILILLIIGLNAASPLREEIFEQSLGILKSIRDDIKQSEIIAKIVRIAPPLILCELTNLAQEMSYSKSRAESLLSLYPFLEQSLKSEVSNQILNAAEETDDLTNRQIILLNAVHIIRGEFQEEILESVLNEINSLTYEHQQSEVIDKFVEVAPDKYLLGVRTIIRELKDAQHQAAGELSLAGRLVAKGDFESAIPILKRFDDIVFEKQYASALIKMAPYVEETQIPRVLKLISKIFSEPFRSDVLVSYIPYLPKTAVEQLISAYRKMREAVPKTKLLCSIAVRLSELSNSVFLEEAVNAVIQSQLSFEAKEETIEILAP